MREEKGILISQFIDNELELGEKIEFVKEVRSDEVFADEAIELLNQEVMVETLFSEPAPELKQQPAKAKLIKLNFANTASLAALAASLILVIKVFILSPDVAVDNKQIHRFVLHMPEAQNVSIAGSFSGWQNIKMDRAGSSGYWQITLPLDAGEHQYSFIVDGKEQMADPTVPAKQADDFGGENSILKVGDSI